MNNDCCRAYGWSSSAPSHTADYLMPEILRIMKSLGCRRVIDLGSGNGALCGKLKAAGCDVVGVEYDAQGVEIASRCYSDISFYQLDVTADPACLLEKETHFEAAVSTEVVEHLFSPHRLVEYAKSVVRPDGYFVISTPYHGYLKNIALSVLNVWDQHFTALWHGGHIKFWSRKTLTQLLEKNGFKVILFKGIGRVPLFWKSMILVAVPVVAEMSDE